MTSALSVMVAVLSQLVPQVIIVLVASNLWAVYNL